MKKFLAIITALFAVALPAGAEDLNIPALPASVQPQPAKVMPAPDSAYEWINIPTPDGKGARVIKFNTDVVDNQKKVAGLVIKDINNNGDIVGSYLSDGFTQPMIWKNGVMTDLPTIAGNGAVVAVNDNGQAVGYSNTRLSPPGEMTEAGETVSSGVGRRAVFWDSGGKLLELSSLIKDGFVDAVGINQAGQIVGNAAADSLYGGKSYSKTHAVLWHNRQINDLGTLGGNNSFSYAINDSGIVIGQSQTMNIGISHAFRWTKAGGMEDITSAFPERNSAALKINNRGQIVGWIVEKGKYPEYFIWENGNLKMLSDWPEQGVVLDFNDAGRILGKFKGVFGWQNGVTQDFISITNKVMRAGIDADTIKAMNSRGEIAGVNATTGEAVRLALFDDAPALIPASAVSDQPAISTETVPTAIMPSADDDSIKLPVTAPAIVKVAAPPVAPIAKFRSEIKGIKAPIVKSLIKIKNNTNVKPDVVNQASQKLIPAQNSQPAKIVAPTIPPKATSVGFKKRFSNFFNSLFR